jgi:hypothetical protein
VQIVLGKEHRKELQTGETEMHSNAAAPVVRVGVRTKYSRNSKKFLIEATGIVRTS